MGDDQADAVQQACNGLVIDRLVGQLLGLKARQKNYLRIKRMARIFQLREGREVPQQFSFIRNPEQLDRQFDDRACLWVKRDGLQIDQRRTAALSGTTLPHHFRIGPRQRSQHYGTWAAIVFFLFSIGVGVMV